jgi:bla regulator protein blaR1
MTFIANQLSIMGQLGRPVLDQTGLSGNFDFTLEWSPESPNPQTVAADSLPGPTLKEAVAEQLGLKLVSQTGPADFLLIDHLEHPTGN